MSAKVAASLLVPPPLGAGSRRASELTAEQAPNELLPAELVAELAALATRLRRGTGVTAWARAVARAAGGSTEFFDRRPYEPGDDARKLDWRAFAKTSRPLVRRFSVERAPQLNVLLDLSNSTGTGSPNKLHTLLSLAAAFAYLGTAVGAHVQLWLGQGERVPRAGGSASSRNALPQLLSRLRRARPEGSTHLQLWLQALCARPGPASTVVLSDFFSDEPLAPVLARARLHNHELTLVQVLSRQDQSPDLAREVVLVDAERNERLPLRFDREAQLSYAQRLEHWLSALEQQARSTGQSYQRMVAGEPLAPIVRRYVAAQLRGFAR